jgi:hypothetical protein
MKSTIINDAPMNKCMSQHILDEWDSCKHHDQCSFRLRISTLSHRIIDHRPWYVLVWTLKQECYTNIIQLFILFQVPTGTHGWVWYICKYPYEVRWIVYACALVIVGW